MGEREVYSVRPLPDERESPANGAATTSKKFSILWKKPQKVFHSVEKIAKSFPYCGKLDEKFSIAWKKRPSLVAFRWLLVVFVVLFPVVNDRFDVLVEANRRSKNLIQHKEEVDQRHIRYDCDTNRN